MNCLFQNVQNKYPREVHIYMDDILVATLDDIVRHKEIVKAILEVMRKESFFLKISKCEFEKLKVEYLKLIVDKNNQTQPQQNSQTEKLASNIKKC